MSNYTKENFVDYIFLMIGIIGFSVKSVFIKLGYSYGVSANSLFILRMVLSLPFYLLVLFFYLRKKSIKNKFQNKQIIFLLVISSICYYIAILSDMYGLEFVNVIIERTILFIFPTIVALLSIVMLGKKYGSRLFISLLICYLGVILTIYSEANSVKFTHHNILYGVILIFISAISYAIFFIASEKALQIIDANIFNTLAMIITCVLAILFNFQFLYQNIFNFDYKIYILALIMAIFSTVMPSFFIMKSISKLGSTTVSIFNNLGLFITSFAGYLFLGEQVTWFQFMGMLLVIWGIVFLKKESHQKR